MDGPAKYVAPMIGMYVLVVALIARRVLAKPTNDAVMTRIASITCESISRSISHGTKCSRKCEKDIALTLEPTTAAMNVLGDVV